MGGLSPLHRRVAGIDVHRMLHVVTTLIEEDDGKIVKRSTSLVVSSGTCIIYFMLRRGEYY